MTTTVYITQWEAAHSSNLIQKETTTEYVLETANLALINMQAMLLQNVDGIEAGRSKSNNGPLITLAAETSHLERLFYFGKNRQRVRLRSIAPSSYASFREQIDSFMDGINLLISKQEEFIKSVENDSQKSAMFIDRADTHMSSAEAMFGLMCDRCGNIINMRIYGAHRQSTKCAVDSANRDVRESGQVNMCDSKHLPAIKKAGIQLTMRPSGFDSWAPSWVMDAVELYEQNGGFGGMSLAEYLKKMKPD